jgi:rare lipoprotein A (peptidoglycan hydrolase)
MASMRRKPKVKRSRAAEWIALSGLGFLVLVAALVWNLGYDGPLGLRPYEIDGVSYAPHGAVGYDEEGIASWYGAPFHGRPAANGTIYDQEAFTAAHKTLPLGTEVRVTNLENGRSALLRITDRGPFVEGRIIDVSRRAARRLGFLGDGLAQVRVRALVSPLQSAARE